MLIYLNINQYFHLNKSFFPTEIEGEVRKISVLQYRSQDDSVKFKILIGFGHIADESCFNHLAGYDISVETLEGKF